MQGRKFILPLLMMLFIAPLAFCQTEALKVVVNNLAIYKQKKELKYLGLAKNEVDSVIKASPDSLDIQRNVYKAVVYCSILYIDSLNKLNLPVTMFQQTSNLVNKLMARGKNERFQSEMDYSRRCLANVYIRKAFAYITISDFVNALVYLQGAKKYVPEFKPLDAYIAYANNKLGNLHAAAKYYEGLAAMDSTKTGYAEAAADIYKSFGDTVTALIIIKKARKISPNDKSLLLDEANIYINKKDYHSLQNLLPALLAINTNNADIAFVAANCYDHLNQFNNAEPLYLRSIELNSSAYDPIFNLGLLYFKKSQKLNDADKAQDEAKAAQWLEKANEIAPNETACLQVLKLVYQQTGNQDQINKINNKINQLNN